MSPDVRLQYEIRKLAWNLKNILEKEVTKHRRYL